jgi:hypothetical protein
MEITFSKNTSYSLDLSKGSLIRELADHLDITVKEMRKLVDKGMLFELHDDAILSWMENKAASWEETESGEIDIDQITW